MEINRNLSKQPFPTDSGRITLQNSLRNYVHLLKSPDFRLLVLKCGGSYSQTFTVYDINVHILKFEIFSYTHWGVISRKFAYMLCHRFSNERWGGGGGGAP